MIETERLCLRKLTPKDKETIRSFLGDPDVMYAWEHGFSDKEVEEWLQKNILRYEKDGCGYLLAVDKSTQKAVGAIGLMHSDIDGEALWEIGYILAKECWGKGYATEGARGCAEYAFSQMGVKKVALQMRTNNAASVKTAEKLGARRVSRYDRFYCGKYMPHYVYILEK